MSPQPCLVHTPADPIILMNFVQAGKECFWEWTFYSGLKRVTTGLIIICTWVDTEYSPSHTKETQLAQIAQGAKRAQRAAKNTSLLALLHHRRSAPILRSGACSVSSRPSKQAAPPLPLHRSWALHNTSNKVLKLWHRLLYTWWWNFDISATRWWNYDTDYLVIF